MLIDKVLTKWSAIIDIEFKINYFSNERIIRKVIYFWSTSFIRHYVVEPAT